MKPRNLVSVFAALFVVVLFAVLVSACGDSGTTTQGASNAATPADSIPDPCTLLTKEEAAAILGEPVNEPNRSIEETSKSCVYITMGTPQRMATVLITRPCSMADYANYAEDPNAMMVEGIGMHASWNQKNLLVHTASGDTCVTASSPAPGSTEPSLEQSKQVATKVLEQLDPDSIM